MQQQEFDRLLKNSSFFFGAMNNQRNAMADIVGAFLASLVQSGAISTESVLASLATFGEDTDSPTADSSRRALVAQIRLRIQGQ